MHARSLLAFVVVTLAWSGLAAGQAGDTVGSQPWSVQPPPEPSSGQAVSDFDFWLGTWNVSNTQLGNDGSWSDAGRSVAKITPMLDGQVVFERWDGRSGRFANTFGMSLRYFDAECERWVVLLSWPSGNPVRAGLSQMEGVFAEGMCVLYPPTLYDGPGAEVTGRATRFVFSDAQDESCRWTMQVPVGEERWRSVWSMAFERIEPDEQIEDGTLPIAGPPDSCACAEDAARLADWLVGDWSDAEGAALWATSINRGCGTVLSIDTEHTGELVFVLVYDRSQDRWLAREIGLQTPLKLQTWDVTVDAEGGEFELVGPDGSKVSISRAVDGLVRLGLELIGENAADYELRG